MGSGVSNHFCSVYPVDSRNLLILCYGDDNSGKNKIGYCYIKKNVTYNTAASSQRCTQSD
ncbi:hypothetical protein EFBL_0600 [Effusibacillus lacus]|uniref:Uncharacterized protein n=1 Tax=Effusibacillus lacus TaxID=1348429 RepID=A0A292YIN2_9BACL|nr:hypothetical protein EFBL_0600 [Effusibacillus lacus]